MTSTAAAGPRQTKGGDVPPPLSFVSPPPPPMMPPQQPCSLTTNIVPTDYMASGNSSFTNVKSTIGSSVFYETAEYRCFNTSEIIHLLTPSTTPLPISSAPPLKPPPSGSLYLYDRSKTRNYKNDHHDWVKKPVAARRRARPSNKGGAEEPSAPAPPARYRVREDDVKLRHEGKCRVAAYYARSSVGGGTMRRRSYCLIDPTTLKPNTEVEGGNWVLVHYLDSGEIVAPRSMVIGGGGGGTTSCCLTKKGTTDAAPSSSSASPPPPQSPMVPPSPPPPSSSSCVVPGPPHRVTPADDLDEDAAATTARVDDASLYHSVVDREAGENKEMKYVGTAVETELVRSTCDIPVPPPPLCDRRLQGRGGDEAQLDSAARSALACFSKGSLPSTEYVNLGGQPLQHGRQQSTVTVVDETTCGKECRNGGLISPMISDPPPVVPRESSSQQSPYGDDELGVFGRGAEIKLGGGGVARVEGGDCVGIGSCPSPTASLPVGVVAGCATQPLSPTPIPCQRASDEVGMMGMACPPPPPTLPAAAVAAAGSEMSMDLEDLDVDDEAAQQAGLLRRASALVDSSPLSRILSNIMQFQAAPKMTEEDFVAEWESSTEVEKSEAIEDIYGNAAVVTTTTAAAEVGGGARDDCVGGGAGGAPSPPTSPHDSFGSDHGVAGGGPGTNEFVNELQGEIQEGKLALLEYELDRVSPRDKVGYIEATRLCPQLVSSRDVKLQFLRCENFCARSAAVRLVNYWTKRVELFGRERAFLPLTLEGAMSGDFEDPCFGHTRLLPGTDASGRGIIFLDYTINGSRTTKLRGLWYMAHAALENESIRRNGFIFIVFTCPPIEHFDLRLITEQQYLMGEAFPLRLRASHICKFETKGWFMPIIHAALKFTAGKYMRSRLVFHDGSTEKVMLQLAEYGISRTQLPTGIGGTFTEEEFQQWLALRREAGM